MDLLKKILPFTGIFILIFIVWKWINLNSIIIVVKNINLKFLFLAIFFTFLIILFKILRTFTILKQNKINISFLKFLEIYCNANLLTMVTNLMFSETTSALAVMYNQENKTRVANIYFLCNLSDFLSICLICSICFLINIGFIKNYLIFNFKNFHIYGLIITIIFMLFFLFLLFFRKIYNYIVKIINDLKELILKSYINLIKFTFFVYVFYIIACYFDARAFNINIDLFYLLFVYSLGSLISVIPISVNGFGTREALFIFLLKFKDVPSEKAFALSIFAFAIVIVINLLLIYLYVLIRKLINK